MTIMSQDKELIVNYEQVQSININPCKKTEIAAWFDCNEDNKNGILLGTYETSERAMEVLDEILLIYSINYIYKHTKDVSVERETTKELIDNRQIPGIYRMPKK